MFVVAVCALAGSIDDEAPHLAAAIGATPYEARMLVSRGTPAVVLRTGDKEPASKLLADLRGRGHEAVACDESAVASGDTLASIRAFRFGETSLDGDAGPAGATVSLPYGSIAALVRAMRPLRSDVKGKVTERKFRAGMAIATGGLILSKKVTREVSRTERDKEGVLYVFVRGAAPWLLGERGLVYASLPNPAPTQRENFQRVVAELRERAPAAPYDERLLAFRARNDEGEVGERELDLHAHLVALSLHARARQP